MAPSIASAELATLRALTTTCTAAATALLPQLVPALAASLADCRSLLSATPGSASKASSEASVAIHKYRSSLATLLQHRTPQGRWCAIVLIKATIEIGGWETLHKSQPWVRGLLGVLTKPDPPSSKKLAIITLTRIFTLTREYQTLARDITTPALPTFIQSCLQLASSKTPSSLLQTILDSFHELLPRHPAIFRPYLKQLQHLLGLFIAPTPSSTLGREQTQLPKAELSAAVSTAARRLYVQLPCSAPKGASSEEWANTLQTTIRMAHNVADEIFRAVVEDWQPPWRDQSARSGIPLDHDVQELEVDAMGLPPWSGIFAGSEKLVGLLRLVKEYLQGTTAVSVSLNVSYIMELLTRLLSLTVPSSTGSKIFPNAPRFNNQVSKEERENLWLILPNIHVMAIDVLYALTCRCEANAALDSLILEQLVWVFSAEKGYAQIRTSCYSTTAQILSRSGIALPKSSIDPLGAMIRVCCEDLLSSHQDSVMLQQNSSQNKANANASRQGSMNADAFLNQSPTLKDPMANFSGLKQAAHELLPVLLSNIKAQYLSDSLRARLDRTAILTQDKDAMIASVLNPPPSKKFGKPAASIMPLLARSFSKEKEVEGLLRPRMPVICKNGKEEGSVSDMDEDMNEAFGDEEKQEDVVDDHFVGEELDTLLQTESLAGETAMPDVLPAKEKASSQKQQRTALPLNGPPPITSNDHIPNVAEKAAHSSHSAKRPQTNDIPQSPTKRVKISEGEVEATGHTVKSTTMADTSIPSVGPSIALTAPAPAASTATVSPAVDISTTVKEAAGNEGGSDDDDDDDIGSLVLGQDSDEEDE